MLMFYVGVMAWGLKIMSESIHKEWGADCPSCERDDFASERGMRSHHARTHGEPLPNRICPNCGGEWYWEKADQQRVYCDDCKYGYKGDTLPVQIQYHKDKQLREYLVVGETEIQMSRVVAIGEFGLDSIVGKDVHHKNGITWDNRPENLEPMSRSDHMRRHATTRVYDKGENHKNAKLSNSDVEEIREKYETGDYTQGELGEEYGVSRRHIGSIVNREVRSWG